MNKAAAMAQNEPTIEEKKTIAAEWFAEIRDSICATFEHIETELEGTPFADQPPATFTYKHWEKDDTGNITNWENESPSHAIDAEAAPEGRSGSEHTHLNGGTIAMMKGRVFEKVGVNISTTTGVFDPAFAKEIPGAADDPHYWASGISLVAHMRSPRVPAAHFNTRMIVVGRENPTLWFGGGGDLNPMVPVEQDTKDFHNYFKRACDSYNPEWYPAFRDWCAEYFFIKHRNQERGVGGIFYDYLGLNQTLASGNQTSDTSVAQDVRSTDRASHEPAKASSHQAGDKQKTQNFGGNNVSRGPATQAGMALTSAVELDWDTRMQFTRDVGEAFRDGYADILRRHLNEEWTEQERAWQLTKRGYYAEYNLLYDRGTRFGLMAGGNPEAILMSLPPVAEWD